MDTEVAWVLSGAVGLVLGAAITFIWKADEKRRIEPEAVEAPLVPPGAEAVLRSLASSAVLVDTGDEVTQTSAPAVALGIVREGHLYPEALLELVRQVRRDGQIREADVEVPVRRSAPLQVHARVAPLTSRLMLVLAEDRTQAQRLDMIRRDFVANVSHELKTPIGAIKLLAEAVSEATDDPEAVTRFSARMGDEAERLTRLVQQIIDLSRLQADTLSEDAVTIKVGELVAEACEHSMTEAESKGISLRSSVDGDLYVHGDRAQLHAAVSNLVENAVTYSPEQSRVAVSAKRVDGDVKVTVSDNGVGIPASELERIFERFYRVDPARARSTGGTGLGLSIVKHVAASNGGSVEVWSEPGLGSTFTLVLPAFDSEIDEEK
ncbi:sensor histidine kinase [Aeromicrobium alkaliterrae]|uniref:sensor histidine kinase n=1 Tax=Aeromicrobium alkaliterrae TaxID=302168 RepID=UPI0031D791F4